MNISSADRDNSLLSTTDLANAIYSICIKGHLDPRWSDWFDGFTIACTTDGNTNLSGTVFDQAALHGLLNKVRDLGMPLISVNAIEPGQLVRG